MFLGPGFCSTPPRSNSTRMSNKMKILPRRPLGDMVLSEEEETCLPRIRVRTPAKLPILARNVPRSTPIVNDSHGRTRFEHLCVWVVSGTRTGRGWGWEVGGGDGMGGGGSG